MSLNFKFSEIIALTLGVFIAVFYYTEIYTNLYWTFGILLFFFGITIAKKPKLLFGINFDSTLFYFTILIFYYFFNSSKEVIFSYSLYSEIIFLESTYIYDYLYGLILICISYLIGRNYSHSSNFPLKIFSKIVLIQIVAFIIYVIPNTFTQETQVSLGFGVLLMATLPYLLTAVKFQNNKYNIIFILILIFYLFIISNRGSLLALSMFLLTYILYPTLIKSPKLYKLYLIFNFLIIILLIYLYLTYFNLGSELSIKYFSKSLDSGRPNIWFQLIQFINDKLLFGYGSDQRSSYLQSSHSLRVSLSSHSLYLETLLVGGLVGLLLLLSLIYSLWVKLYLKKENYWGKVGSCLVISMIYGAGTGSILVTGNMMFNFMTWFFLGVAVIQVQKNYDKKN